jgi:chitinase
LFKVSANQKDDKVIQSRTDNESIIVGYFPSWSIYQPNFFITDIPTDKITHINYAFANIGPDGRIERGDNEADTDKVFPGDTWDQPLRGNFNQLIKLKEKYPYLRTLISVGGWVNI